MSDTRKLSAVLIAISLACPTNAAAAPPAIDDELNAALDLYDSGHRLAAAEAAEALLLRADVSPSDRRAVTLLAAAGRRDAFREAPAGQQDPTHLCTALRILDAYLAEPTADPRVGVMRTEISTMVAADPSFRCAEPAPPDPPPPAAVSPPVVEPTPAPPATVAPPPPLHAPDESARATRRRHIVGGTLLGVAGLAVVGTAISVGMYDLRFRQLDAQDRRVTTPMEATLVDWLSDAARDARTSAIVLGAATGALLVAGVAVLATPRRPGRMSAAPAVSPSAWGLSIAGRF